MTVRGGKLTGEAKRSVLVNRTVKAEQSSLIGDVSKDGKVTLKLWNRTFPGTLTGGQLVARYAGNECDYDLKLARAG